MLSPGRVSQRRSVVVLSPHRQYRAGYVDCLPRRARPPARPPARIVERLFMRSKVAGERANERTQFRAEKKLFATYRPNLLHAFRVDVRRAVGGRYGRSRDGHVNCERSDFEKRQSSKPM